MKKFVYIILIICFIGCNNGMDYIYKQVINDSLQQYFIAKKQGDKIQICVQAGLVSASYLQAKDETNYIKWKSIEKDDCYKAGLR